MGICTNLKKLLLVLSFSLGLLSLSLFTNSSTVLAFDDRDLPASSDGKEITKEEMQEFKRTMEDKNSSSAFEGTGHLNPTTDE